MFSLKKLRREFNFTIVDFLTAIIEIGDRLGAQLPKQFRFLIPFSKRCRSYLVIGCYRRLERSQGIKREITTCGPRPHLLGSNRHQNQESRIEPASEECCMLRNKFKIAIKIAAPCFSELSGWGDFHFASCLAHYLEKLGHTVRIDPVESWYQASANSDDAAIVLRGLEKYRPLPYQLSVMWLISHPEEVDLEELNAYGHIFVASKSFSDKLRDQLEVSVSPLLQCTDPRLFYPSSTDKVTRPKFSVLFVGSSRGVFRRSVRIISQSQLPLIVIGSGWNKFISTSSILSSYVPYVELRSVYQSCRVLVNDHWDDMRNNGFISNRLFDAVASQTRVLTEEMDGVSEIFGNTVTTYKSDGDFLNKLSSLLESQDSPPDLDIVNLIREEHSFERRAQEIDRTLQTLNERYRFRQQAFQCG